MKQPRLFFLTTFLLLFTAACTAAPESPAAAPTLMTPTDTPVPPTPTSTPDPLASVDLRDPGTYPEWMSYFTRGEFPTPEAQHEMSADMFTLYRNMLTDRGIEGVEALNDSQVFFMAGQIANQEGWNLPANLDVTRDWFAGAQGAAHASLDGSYQNGIFSQLQLGDRDTFTLPLAQTPGEITTNIFGENVLLQRSQPFFGAIANEAILVNLTEGKQAIILHYNNEGQDYYFPLTVLFEDTQIEGVIRAPGGQPPFIFAESSSIVPASIGANGSFNNDPNNVWTEDNFRSQLIEAGTISITSFSGDYSNKDPIVNGLEFAYFIQIIP